MNAPDCIQVREVACDQDQELGIDLAAALNAALVYAARRDLGSPPRNHDGPLRGEEVYPWFYRMLLHAAAHPSAEADEMITTVVEVDLLPKDLLDLLVIERER